MALASPRVIFWVLPYLILLLIGGTIAQKYHGLYDATRTYFSSFFFFLGPVPLPAGYSVIGLLSLSLLAKLVVKSEWSLKKGGIILTHAGVLIVLLGGIVSAMSAREGFLYLPEGDETSLITSYWDKELVIADKGAVLQKIPFETITPGQVIKGSSFPFSLTVLQRCDHCTILQADTRADVAHIGPAQFMKLESAPRRREAEENIAGLTLLIQSAAGEVIGETIAFDGFPKPIEFDYDDNTYAVALVKAKTEMPFSVRLVDFKKELHEGSTTVVDYHSDVVIADNLVNHRFDIAMNEPARYRGYSMYQSSFDAMPDGREVSIIAVVENDGWLFPYISGIVFMMGLIWHVWVMMRSKKDGLKKEAQA